MSARLPPRNGPLHLSAMDGNIEITKLLVSLVKDPYVINADGESPIQLAIQESHVEIIEFLQSKQDEYSKVQKTKRQRLE